VAEVKEQNSAAVVLVPCARRGHAGCEIVRKAAARVLADTPEATLIEAADCPRGVKRFLLALDGSSACSASQALADCGVRPSQIVSAPAVLAKAGLVKPGVPVAGLTDELGEALAEAIREALAEVVSEARDRARYAEEMAPALKRFRDLWSRLEALGPPPNGQVEEEVRSRVELMGRRSRNLFTRLDEVSPPSAWAEPHDLFQDALLCIAYATEGWTVGNQERWETNLEKARVQVEPLLRRLS